MAHGFLLLVGVYIVDYLDYLTRALFSVHEKNGLSLSTRVSHEDRDNQMCTMVGDNRFLIRDG